ncbi:MAG TPA: SufS family cysteine desulfurase [Candidatus Poseidoniales archaeon]|nr:MAG: cysteine desulfurase [Euryarchaeota archaeon]HIG03689.1 SufS family cysteine desulfurase [Candidatus Poseidoniales archaeon]HIK78109.1 SufS family cysteine desulfurase [Candidatus Poseidoniales archaeon]
MIFDPYTCRKDFPILNRILPNGKPLVYLDNSATTQKPSCVIDAMSRYYLEYNSNVHRAVHTLSSEATNAYEGAREMIADWFGLTDGNLLFTSGTTEAINLVAHSWGRANLSKGDVIVLTEMEHHSDIVPWQMLAEETGVELRWVPFDKENFQLDMAAFEMSLEDAKLVCCIHTSNVLGIRNPVEEIISLAHNVGARVLIDAAQAAPHDRIGISELGADFVAVSAHKMSGPTGIGALFVNAETLTEMKPFLGGGDMIREVFLDHSTYQEGSFKFEAGTPKIAEAIGWAEAVKWLSNIGFESSHSHSIKLAQKVADAFRNIPGMTVLGRQDNDDAPLISFIHDSLHAADMAQMLDAHGIAIRTGHHCAQPLLRSLGLTSTNRASFYLYNTEEEADFLIETVQKLVERFS